MEKRFVVFLVVAVAIWMGYLGLRMWLVPPAPPVAEKPADTTSGKDSKKAAKKTVDPPSSTAGTDTVETPQVTASKPSGAVRKAAGRKRVTLGSLDPETGYRMLATFDSRGAALERVELSSPRYRDLEYKAGYLGHLYLTDAKGGGARVNLVGPGTPAALAKAKGDSQATGLQPGDVIVAIGGHDIANATAVELFLETTKPDQTIELTVKRQANDEATTIALETTLTRRPMEVIRPERPIHYRPDGTQQIMPQCPPSLLMSLHTLGTRTLKIQETEFDDLPSLRSAEWDVEEQGADFVAFSTTIDVPASAENEAAAPLKIVKRYTLGKAEKEGDPGYDIDLKIEFHNEGDQPQQVAYRLDGPNGLPLEGWWYSVKLHPKIGYAAGARDAVWKVAGEAQRLIGCPEVVSEAREAISEQRSIETGLLTGSEPKALQYVGVDAQFFSSVLMPQPKANDEPILFTAATTYPLQDVSLLEKQRNKTANVTVRLVTRAETIPPGESLVHGYRVFTGPKAPELLEPYGLNALIEYGWAYAAVPARILLSVLNGLYYVTQNYGLSIILLTLIVRTCMVPFSLRQAKSAATMQLLAPEMQKIKEKYANDMEKQGQAMRELYAKHKFNPFGGCLLLFFQLPVFVGLYRCLSVDIELRDASLIPGLAWASNLAGPDMLYYWKPHVWSMIGDEAHGWLGPYFNILPLFTVALFLIQQKMFTPPATDEQSRMQQQMMTYMTVFMGIMFYKVPAGLCLYFITSSLWSLAERKLLPKPKPPSETASSSATKAEPPAKPTSSGSNGATGRRGGKKQKKR